MIARPWIIKIPRLTPHEAYTTVRARFGRYPNDGAIYVVLEADDGEPYAVFSKNLRSYGAKITDSEFHVDANNCEALMAPMMESGLFEDTGRKDSSGFCDYPVWRIKDPTKVPPTKGPA